MAKHEHQEVKIMAFAKPKTDSAPVIAFEKTQMETKLLSLEEMDSWVLPPFQRDEVQTKKVIEFAELLKQNGGMISGVIHLGLLRGSTSPLYLVDGQQRRSACHLSGVDVFIADTSVKLYDSMVEMAEDFKRVNSRLVPLKPDDLLRACEVTHEPLAHLRRDCPFVGYGNIRRQERSPVLSMSAALKSWFGSGLPTPGTTGQAIMLLDQLSDTQRQMLTVFLLMAYHAWGTDKSNSRLWSNPNITMCMYLYRKLMLEPNNRRAAVSGEIFGKCLMGVSANSSYYEWLQGRHLTERDRSPAYKRLRSIFAERLTQEYGGGKLFRMPSPDWIS
jgi:hypothetical protein